MPEREWRVVAVDLGLEARLLAFCKQLFYLGYVRKFD